MKNAIVPAIPPLIGLSMAGLYSVLNLWGEVFVRRFGCGCRSGFNTNSLTLWFGAAVLVLVCAGCVMSGRFIRPGLRSAYLSSTIGGSILSLAAFVFLNAWA